MSRLQVSFDTLMEVRVVEEGPGGCSNAVEVDRHSQESPAVNATTVEISIKSPQPSTVSQAPVEPTISVQLNSTSRADNTPSNHSEFRARGVSEGEKVGRSSTADPEPALVQLTDAGTALLFRSCKLNTMCEFEDLLRVSYTGMDWFVYGLAWTISTLEQA